MTPWAMVGNAARHSWHLWQRRQLRICNLQILFTHRGFESLSLRHKPRTATRRSTTRPIESRRASAQRVGRPSGIGRATTHLLPDRLPVRSVPASGRIPARVATSEPLRLPENASRPAHLFARRDQWPCPRRHAAFFIRRVAAQNVCGTDSRSCSVASRCRAGESTGGSVHLRSVGNRKRSGKRIMV